MIELQPQQLDQRIETIRGAFRKLGSVEIQPTPKNSPRTVKIIVTSPGHPSLPTTATMQFVEHWQLDGNVWRLTKYTYDLFLEPKEKGGRYGYHWHDGGFHRICWDPRVPDRDRHFKGDFIDIFAAFEHFARLLAGEQGISCAGLEPDR